MVPAPISKTSWPRTGPIRRRPCTAHDSGSMSAPWLSSTLSGMR